MRCFSFPVGVAYFPKKDAYTAPPKPMVLLSQYQYLGEVTLLNVSELEI